MKIRFLPLLVLGWFAPALLSAQTAISNLTYSSGQNVTVSGSATITAGPAVTVASGANVTYSATTAITLSPGFTASAGSAFHAIVEGGANTYVLTVVNGTGGGGGLLAGTKRTIVASAPPAGQIFIAWAIGSGSGTIANSASPVTTFTMVGSSATVTAVFGSAADNDGDGIPDAWASYYGLNPNSGADPDHDGLSNIAEFNLGSHPQGYNQGPGTRGGDLPAGWAEMAAADASVPTTLAVGTTAGTLAVDKSGAATYSIPLWVSPGVAGMAPQLSLNYSSQAGNGIAGFGWSLGGVSAISRGPQTRAIDNAVKGITFSSDDRFYLDGQRLMLVSGTQGADGSLYRTELESFTKVQAVGGSGGNPSYFKAWTKAGLIIEFGNGNSSAFQSAGMPAPLTWQVSKISDTSGNSMTFSYSLDSSAGEQRLASIDYSGDNHVSFEYEDRPDTARGYAAGGVIASSKRLATVHCWHGSTAARTYTFHYTASATANARSLLTALTETGAYGQSYPDLVFDYEAPTGGWDEQPGFAPPYPFAQKDVQLGVGLMDVNGDGLPDFVRRKIYNSGAQDRSTYLNTASGWSNSTDYAIPGGALGLAWEGRVDAGARFVDLDGDGLVDIIFSNKESNGTVSNYALRNTGTGWVDYNEARLLTSEYSAGSVYISIASQSDSGRRLIDVNGDGLVDIVWNSRNDGGDKGCLLNNSDGHIQPNGPFWVRDDRWAPPFPLVEDVSSGAVFMDVNGDGLPDLIQHGLSQSGIEAGVAINTSSGWVVERYNGIIPNSVPYSTYSTSPAYGMSNLGKYLPPTILTKDGTGRTSMPMGTEVVDLNGDGLPDVIMSNPKTLSTFGSPRAYLNTGNGWVSAPEYAPPAGVALRGRVSGSETDTTGAVLADINGDGLVDLAVNMPGQSVYYLNTGHGWGAASSSYMDGVDLYLPQAIAKSDPSDPTGTQLADLNGDGIVDSISNTGSAYFNRAKPTAGRLKAVTNGLGVVASIAYKPLTDSSVYTKGTGGPAGSANVTGPMYVVSTLTHDDGVQGTYEIDYTYGGLRVDRLHGSLGFATMTVKDTRKNIVSATTFRQDYPFIGMPSDSSTISGSVTLKQSAVTYDEKLLNSNLTHFIFAKTTTETTHDLDGSLVSSVTTSVPAPATDIDDYGNIKKLVVDSGDGFTKTTDSSYDTTSTTIANWFLGRLTSSTVTSTAPDGAGGTQSIVRESAFTYYPDTGLLEKEIVEPDDSTLTLKLTTTYGYDSHGNKTSVAMSGANVTVDANGALSASGTVTRTTRTDYDSLGRFPASTTVYPDQSDLTNTHTETYSYDPNLGTLGSVTGPNGIPTSVQIDSFGRKIRETRADGTVTDTYYNWASSAAPAGAKYLVATETYLASNHATVSAPTLAFYDRFGRVFSKPAINGDGAVVWQETEFDDKGRVTRTSNPHFAGAATIYWSGTSVFDGLDRPKSTYTPDDQNGPQTTSLNYTGLTVSVTDPKGRVSKTVKNSQGWTVENVRNDGNSNADDYSRVAYTYDALGNLTKTDAAQVVTSLGYDLRGRKTSMADPDMGSWLYRYNIFGELIWQKDAKGQITTLAYDGLGRLRTRVEPEGTTTWTYDTSPRGTSTWKGKLSTVTSPGNYAETYTYDSIGRPSKLTRAIDSGTYDFDSDYDSFGRLRKTTYPTVNGGRFATRQVYNTFGYLKEIRGYLSADDSVPNDQLQGQVYWQADHYDQSGRIDGELLGNGLANDRVYSEATGRLLGASIDKGRVTAAPYAIQQMVYTYDQVGNVVTRSDQAVGRGESFAYDGLDRLLAHNVVTGVGGTVSVTYDQTGNIKTKSDVGTYAYDPTKKHALTGVSGGTLGTQSYTYDDNGNMTGGGGRAISWTSFNQALSITKGAYSSTFSFGASHERVKQVSHLETTIYVGALFEQVTPAGSGTVTEYKHYIAGPTGRIAVYTDRSNLVRDTRYFHTDGLGSITAISDEKGAIVKRFAFDAWGKRIDPASGATITGATAGEFRRGYTDHEQLDDLGLVHMNGRIYDPILGRFLSADPHVSGVSDAQGFNRYSYVGNNPLGAVDPTGFFNLKDALKIVAVVAVAVVAAVYIGPWIAQALANSVYGAGAWGVLSIQTSSIFLGIGGGIAGGFASGFAGSLLNGGGLGDAFRSGMIGGLTGGISGGLLGYIGGQNLDPITRGLAHGLVQGGGAEATGGEFRHGFYAGFAVGSTEGWIGSWARNSDARGIAAGAVIGGTASAIGGGRFANGAVSGAFSYMFNHLGGVLNELKEAWRRTFSFVTGGFSPVEHIEPSYSEESKADQTLDRATAKLSLAPAAMAERSPIRSIFLIGGGDIIKDRVSMYGVTGVSFDSGFFAEGMTEVGKYFAGGGSLAMSMHGLDQSEYLFLDTHGSRYGAGGYVAFNGFTPTGEFGLYAYGSVWLFGEVGGGASFDTRRFWDLVGNKYSGKSNYMKLYGF